MSRCYRIGCLPGEYEFTTWTMKYGRLMEDSHYHRVLVEMCKQYGGINVLAKLPWDNEEQRQQFFGYIRQKVSFLHAVRKIRLSKAQKDYIESERSHLYEDKGECRNSRTRYKTSTGPYIGEHHTVNLRKPVDHIAIKLVVSLCVRLIVYENDDERTQRILQEDRNLALRGSHDYAKMLQMLCVKVGYDVILEGFPWANETLRDWYTTQARACPELFMDMKFTREQKLFVDKIRNAILSE